MKNLLNGTPVARTVCGSATPRFHSAIRLGKILVPIDFSEESEKALRYALSLAEYCGASITLLHVVEPISFAADYGYGTVARLVPDEERVRKAKTKLKAVGQKLVGVPLLAETIVLSGTSDFEITEAAKALETDLIIIGTHGHSGLTRAVIGSTAEKVVRHAPCPVLVVRQGKSLPSHSRRADLLQAKVAGAAPLLIETSSRYGAGDDPQVAGDPTATARHQEPSSLTRRT